VVAAHLVIQEVKRHRSLHKHMGGKKLYHVMRSFLLAAGIRMGRDALFDLLREEGLLVRRRRRRRPRTTFSWRLNHYPNLIKDLEPIEVNRVWVSDITYIRIGSGFCYLSLITDAYSRKIVGYCLRRDMRTIGCLEALRRALRSNPDRRSLIHHSDRGLQYYSCEYRGLLESHGIRISMTEQGQSGENNLAERINGILKDEYLRERLDSFDEARSAVARAIEIYNNIRPHMSVDMLTPAEAHLRSGELKRRWKNNPRRYQAALLAQAASLS
jgi:putative transposase